MTIRWMQSQGEQDRGLDQDHYNSEDYELGQEFIDEALGLNDEAAQQNITQASLSEAQARIEQANLYQTLINHSLFAPNSARPEIMDLVENEIRSFAMERLEILLGMKASQPKNQPQVLPFDDDEIEALKAIAGQLNKRSRPSTPVERTPGINAVGSQPAPVAPAIRQVSAPAPKQPVVARQKAPVVPQKQAAPVQPQRPAGPVQPKTQDRKRRSRKMEDVVVSEKGSSRDYSQAVNPNAPPLPMPREIHITSTSGMVQTADSVGSMNMNQLSGAVMDAMSK